MKNLKAMSVAELTDLRKRVDQAIAQKVASETAELQSRIAHLQRLKLNGAAPKPSRRKSRLKGRTLAPKYRNPKNRSETWAGRGAQPRWLVAAIKAGKKAENFLIDKSGLQVRARKKKRARQAAAR